MSANKKSKDLVSNKDGVKKKWWNKKKIVALSILAVAALAAIIASIVVLATTVFPIPSTAEESAVVGRFEYNTLYYDVKYEELRYVTLLNKRILDNELGKYNDLNALEQIEYEKLLKERVMEDIKSNVTILALCDEFGIRTDSLILRMRVQQDIQDFVNENFDGDAEKYKEGLKEEGLTDSLLRYTFRINRLHNQLQEYFVKNKIDIKYDETNISEFIDYVMKGEDWVRTIHIYYPDEHPHTSEKARDQFVAQFQQGELSDAEFKDFKQAFWNDLKDKADKYNSIGAFTKAKEAVNSLLNTKNDDDRYDDMKSLIGTAPYVNDLSMPSNVAGIYMTYGQMEDAYVEAAFDLQNYGVSRVIRTDGGYFVIMRLPLQEEDVKKQVTDLLIKYQYVPLKLREDEVRAELLFLDNVDFKSLNLIDIE